MRLALKQQMIVHKMLLHYKHLYNKELIKISRDIAGSAGLLQLCDSPGVKAFGDGINFLLAWWLFKAYKIILQLN